MSTHRFCIAPMMDWTDRHDRYFLRLLSKRSRLYSEMVTADAVRHGDRAHLLSFNATEHPVALQLGGSDASTLAEAAKIGEDFGYDEINLNVGCPSDRVQAGRFGACLMQEPELVAECVSAMRVNVKIPVTVKSRIGVDDQDPEEALFRLVELSAQA
ncbi:MAG TPA: tRNA dihydrouridine(20/20a) synthase DusA, partial [Rhodobiaceae bacterium]|nr:tRNA dihydrouridine(20/20a) synthase DusA [Rhodobiaceae bacterium]